ncbi:bifunctional UDP-sugar hydrolase/5'-nucleotidase [Planococcus sp. N028]|uniref:Bifunctional UDP-sugar hydrolase/5'-nucleotidase n=1 Tax=Planococcus shixiaomingii TaxID=3058393 RepID=A0ABT8N6T6_9BACL|nr:MULTISPECIES: bifunctional UDP-sugar hydrolase/5'-nucleotidase [unclassified Planococcus (in: firmicutes)]MDN7243587.1 bifunctional UDP-sugar hydrolase/5'-nucleotidase [Planococcus sp. N028]WKA56022.1 bifunctional UDP-sugar hydrolase/5'-nucleotidase [Planococcus sp. N022]
MSETIHIYHTNDLHSHFGPWPSIKNLLNERKRWHEEEGDTCLILDIGDHVDRSHPFTEGTAGRGNVVLLNEACYDAVTIGNNEGITLSKEELNDLYVQADFDVIVGNLKDTGGERPVWAKPHHILVTEGGVRIGLVGATAEFTPFYKRLGWTISDGKDAIMEAVEEIKGQTDLIVCLSHLGVKDDELLAEMCPDIDVILGAHTHHLFHDGKMIGNTLLAATGKFGAYIGHVTIESNLVGKKAYLIETAALRNPDESFDESLMKEGKSQLNEPVFYNTEKLKAEWFKDSKLSNLFGQALLEFSQADCALFNAGIFMDDMHEGEITRYDFHKMLPHPINLCLIELTGAELKEIYLQSLNSEWPHIELKGLGFRGAIFGNIIHVNLELIGHKLYINGQQAVHDQVYRLITLDMFTFGYFFPALKRAPKTYFMPEFLRDVFSQFFRSKALK